MNKIVLLFLFVVISLSALAQERAGERAYKVEKEVELEKSGKKGNKTMREVSVQVPKNAKVIAVNFYLKNENDEWQKCTATDNKAQCIGWAWVENIKTTSNAINVTYTATFVNEKHDWNRVGKLEVIYEP
jgi:hypothetical protein